MRNEKDIVILPADHISRPKAFFKIVIIGEAGVGKSTIINKTIPASNDTIHQPNYAFGFSWKNYTIDGVFYRLQIWDTCGQELYHSIVKNFYTGAYLAYLVFGLDDYNSFCEAKRWLKEIKESQNRDIIIFLIGNKSDTKQRKVSMKQIEDFKTENDIEYYIETSAKDGTNTEQLFEDTIRKLYYNYVVLAPEDTDFDCSSKNIVLGNEDNGRGDINEEEEEKSCRVCLC